METWRTCAGFEAGVEMTFAALALASAAICFMELAATVAGFRVDVAIDRATIFDDV